MDKMEYASRFRLDYYILHTATKSRPHHDIDIDNNNYYYRRIRSDCSTYIIVKVILKLDEMSQSERRQRGAGGCKWHSINDIYNNNRIRSGCSVAGTHSCWRLLFLGNCYRFVSADLFPAILSLAFVRWPHGYSSTFHYKILPCRIPIKFFYSWYRRPIGVCDLWRVKCGWLDDDRSSKNSRTWYRIN